MVKSHCAMRFSDSTLEIKHLFYQKLSDIVLKLCCKKGDFNRNRRGSESFVLNCSTILFLFF